MSVGLDEGVEVIGNLRGGMGCREGDLEAGEYQVRRRQGREGRTRSSIGHGWVGRVASEKLKR